MWVLSTDRAELHYFPSPQDVRGGYAILSHVWDESEKTFEDVQNTAKECKENGTNPRDFVSAKIRECCVLAKRHGYRWIWNDTCCIDKRSSTELSEAINSMFRYYSLAKVCYAYLRDVPTDDIPHSDHSAFRRSRWHKRGWTLQELIAPKFLIFVASDWRPLGGRAELSDVLEQITKIPARLLRLETKVSDYSAAQRMSWAAPRSTTREEDRAYSLMGLFGIYMSTLYGEGRNAFRRLQEEIMKQSVDPSLFLWGVVHLLDRETLEAVPPACDHEGGFLDSYPLASSPSVFEDCAGIEFLPLRSMDVAAAPIEKPELTEHQAATGSSSATPDSGRNLRVTFTLTPYGVHAHLPTVQGSRGVVLAILPCYRQEKRFGLLLSPCMHPSDPLRPLYHTALSSWFRVVTFDDVQSLRVRDEPVAIEWKDVYITVSSPPPQDPQWDPLPTPLINSLFSPPFRISDASMRNMQKYYRMHTESPTSPTWTGIPHVTAVFRRPYTNSFMAILLGRCTAHCENAERRKSGRLGPHWAAVAFYTSQDQTTEAESYEHTCPYDHVGPNFTIRVEDPHITETAHRNNCWVLSFAPCRINPGTTLVVDVDLLEIPQPSEAAATYSGSRANNPYTHVLPALRMEDLSSIRLDRPRFTYSGSSMTYA